MARQRDADHEYYTAQLAKCQDVCPECKGEKFVPIEMTMHGTRIPHLNYADCPTCKGTGKKQDSDKGKIAEIMWDFRNKEKAGGSAFKWVNQILAITTLEEHEIKHIEIALKDHYKDEWCSVCDGIAKKLRFNKAFYGG